MLQMAQDAWMDTLRRLLAEAFNLHQKGAAGVPLGRAYGVADGYMLALIDMRVATPKELSRFVAEERTRQAGPASRTLGAADLDTARDTLAA
jgi:hypothetical protein